MSKKRLGMTLVCPPTLGTPTTISGIFTDGDLRRALDHTTNIHTTRIHSVMTRNFKTILPSMRASEALEIMESLKITALPVMNSDNHLMGIVHIHDLL